jgi:hypothetical protein
MALAVHVRAALSGDTLHIGDVVVTMSYPGMFTVTAIDAAHVTIVDRNGVSRTVVAANVRRVTRDPGAS